MQASNQSKYLELFAKLKLRRNPWVLGATVLIFVLIAYYMVQGFQYLQTKQNVAALETQAKQLSSIRAGGETDIDGLKDELANQEHLWQELALQYEQGGSGHLMEMVARAADQALMELLSVQTGTITIEIHGNNRFEVQAINVQLSGEMEELFLFLELLQQDVPAMAISNVGINNLQDVAQVQMGLKFYLSPQPAPQEEDPA